MISSLLGLAEVVFPLSRVLDAGNLGALKYARECFRSYIEWYALTVANRKFG